ncbi:nickel-dependent hydrogenase large subunit [Candidatus Ferrigenium straubiae]|jgi:hydrogenase large subunit|uniref:nickel-dependent hydrogenase large subunit n=1 Tax=Candidatus Ferrigenium straubiae TaxID=2919506 RepID=UPI003F4AC11B
MSTVVIDPITRIEGHLRIEAETNSSGMITKASASGTMVRGIEIILKGRDPRDAWAFTQRICGVCTVVHALTSVRAVENALGYAIPTNARHIRNLMMGTQLVQDHVTHFYQLASMDWVNVVSASQADATATSNLQKCTSGWHKNSPAYFEAVRQKLAGFIAGGQLGLFGNAYFDHPAYKLPPEMNLMLFAHWLEALEWQRKVLRVHAVFGGRNPHPNFAIGGVPCTFNMSPNAAGVLVPTPGTTGVDQTGLDLVQGCITEIREFVAKVYRPDALALGAHYKDWFGRGESLGNFLTFGEYPQDDSANISSSLFVPRGAIIGRDLSNVQPVDLRNPDEVQEFVTHSWYDYSLGKNTGLHPFQGETTLNYTGPQANYQNLDVNQSYSWVKAPRWKGNAMEVGPLARVLMMYATGNRTARDHVDRALRDLKLPFSAMYSTMGRMLAQSIDAHLVADELQVWFNQLTANVAGGDFRTHNAAKFDPATWPATTQGIGFTEAPRGALGHWLAIDSGTIANYQCVVPTTWNAAPRDAAGNGGPYEKALVGHVLAVPDKPLEVLRTIHSFNPCMACAVHLFDPQPNETLNVTVSA